MKVALSSVAFPEWTVGRVIDEAARVGYHAVELRTFGTDSTGLASDAARAGGVGSIAGDPLLTSAAKLKRLALDAGIDILSLASSISYDEPIFPPVVGRLRLDPTRSIASEVPMRAEARKTGTPAASCNRSSSEILVPRRGVFRPSGSKP